MIKGPVAVVCVLVFCAQAMPVFSAEAAANYGKICASCHGKDRKGVAAMAKAFKLDPVKMDLTAHIQHQDDAELVKIISDGKGKMPAHKARLKPEEIAALVAYLKAPDTQTADARTAGPKTSAAAPSQPAAMAAESADYKAKCASCHGKDGKGNPSMARMLKVEPAALDLTGKAVREKTGEDLAKLIAGGKGKMLAFKGKLSDNQVKELVKFMKGLVPQEKL